MSSLSTHVKLSTHQLSVGFNEAIHNCLFDDLNLELQAGQLVCFMGPNGVGKSTLIRTLVGLQKPLQGHVQLESTKDKSQSVSVVLTDKVQSVNMTVRELVTLGRYPYLGWNISLDKVDLEKIDQAIALTRIAPISSKKLFEISDGQLQMAMIARAIAQDGDVIILDEPTAHLDLNNRVEIMNLLRTLSRKTAKAILVSTHELDLALQMADLIWLAGKGKTIFTGIPEDLVLNGMFDDIFQFKGFDLKTGKVYHEAHRNISVDLVGEGHEYLWTKNALERSGFEIDHKAPQKIIIDPAEKLSWKIDTTRFDSLKELLNFLEAKN